MNLISSLLENLERFEDTESVTNPYRSPGRRHNLAIYLNALRELPYSGYLLVGEAPGYRGCARTGIPFTSPRLLRTHPHSILKALRPQLMIAGNESEATATMVWSSLQSCSAVPAFWNVFPFHPHRTGLRGSNRPPTRQEKEAGRPFLDRLIDILSPHTLIAVGKVAQAALAQWYPDMVIVPVRHPSHGGKKAYLADLTETGILQG